MTDLNERLAAMLENEPAAPNDIDRLLTHGRRALRRRTALTAVAGTAGTAAITAAVVVPIATAGQGGSTDTVSVGAQPPANDSDRCELYYGGSGGQKATKVRLAKAMERAQAHAKPGYQIGRIVTKHGVTGFEMCPPGVNPAGSPQPTSPPDPTATMPPYHYDADPQTIADGFTSELGKQVKKLGFAIVYSRPFAQESSKVEDGHPSYFDGNVDVQLPDGPADVGVQVTHQVTEQVPFTGECNAPDCTQTTLGDGSVMQISHIDAGSGGAEIITVEIHCPDGVVVQAQESNYAFGPEATKARTKNQPLTIDQLTALARDPAWTF
jgi:hypothetical protein